ncbi:hypothetical protein ACEPAH_2621 [Sanghuangporus vaninii]
MISRLNEKHPDNPEKRVKIILECLRGQAQTWVNGKWAVNRNRLVSTGHHDANGNWVLDLKGGWDSEHDLWNELALNHNGIFGLEEEAERNIRTIYQERARVKQYNRAFNNIRMRLPKHYDHQALIYEYKRGLNQTILKALLTNTDHPKWDLTQWQENASNLEASLIAAKVIGSNRKYTPMFKDGQAVSYTPVPPEAHRPAEFLGLAGRAAKQVTLHRTATM